MVYGFCSKYSYEDYRREVSRQGTTLSQETIADWQSYCREVCMADLDRRFTDQGRIGGETSYVQVDEAKSASENIMLEESLMEAGSLE